MRLAIAILLLSLTCNAQYLQHRRSAFRTVPTAPGSCSTYNTTNAWDNFIEGFEADASFDSNVTYAVWVTNGTVANVNPNYDTSGIATYKPEGACDEALQIIVPGDGTETFVTMDLGAAIDLDTIQTDVYLCLYLDVALANSASIVMGTFGTTATGGNQLTLATTTSQPNIKIAGTTASSVINISADTWYTIQIHFDTARTGATSTMSVWSNGSQVGSSVTWQRDTPDLRYMSFGGVLGVGAGEGGTMILDLVSVKTN